MDAATPFLNLLKNNVVVTAVVTAVITSLIVLFPPLSSYANILVPGIISAIGIAVGGYTVQYVAATHADAKVQAAAYSVQEAQAYAAIPKVQTAQVAVTEEPAVWHPR